MSDSNTMKLRLSKNLRLLMKNYEQKYVADSCQIAESTLHGWLNESTPSFKSIGQIQNLASFFGLAMEELLFGDVVDTDRRIHVQHKINFNGKILKILVEELEDIK